MQTHPCVTVQTQPIQEHVYTRDNTHTNLQVACPVADSLTKRNGAEEAAHCWGDVRKRPLCLTMCIVVLW